MVIDDSPVRADYIFRRGVNNSIGARLISNQGYRSAQMNLTGYTGNLTMEHLGNTIYQQQCECTSLGLVYCEIPASAFSSFSDSVQTGVYYINITSPSGDVTRVSEGYWHML